MAKDKVHPFTKQERRLVRPVPRGSVQVLLDRIKTIEERKEITSLPFDFYLSETDTEEK